MVNIKEVAKQAAANLDRGRWPATESVPTIAEARRWAEEAEGFVGDEVAEFAEAFVEAARVAAE